MNKIIRISDRINSSKDLKRTDHLIKRSSQRGFTNNDIENLFNYADRETYIGEGCISYSISKKAIKSEKLRKIIPIKDLERIKKASLVVADGCGVTIIKNTSNAKHYYKQSKRKFNGKR